jgi:alpha-D-ribose 1-methylphosphonate 5-triphosphate synthase subunit PhnG
VHNTDITEAVIGMDDGEVAELIELLTIEELTITRPPRSGLMMMTARDGFDTDFHLGEVLVTEAEVSIGDSSGYGMVIGEEPRKALARAAAEAVLRSGRPELLCSSVRNCLEKVRQRQAAGRAEDAALTCSTRVSFDLMAGA